MAHELSLLVRQTEKDLSQDIEVPVLNGKEMKMLAEEVGGIENGFLTKRLMKNSQI